MGRAGLTLDGKWQVLLAGAQGPERRSPRSLGKAERNSALGSQDGLFPLTLAQVKGAS